MESILTQFQNVLDNPALKSDQAVMIGIIAAVVVGIVYCFAGYKAMRVISTIIGFGLGIIVGIVITSAAKLENPIDLIVILAAAVIVALLGFFLMRAGTFAAVLLAAFYLLSSILEAYTQIDSTYVMIISLVAGIALAILAAVYLRPVIIAATAIIGGMVVSAQIFDNLIQVRWSSQTEMICRFAAGAFLAVIGMIYQFRTTSDD